MPFYLAKLDNVNSVYNVKEKNISVEVVVTKTKRRKKKKHKKIVRKKCVETC